MTTSTGRMVAFRLLSFFGVLLSAYALYVEHKVSQQKAAKAFAAANPNAPVVPEDDVPFVALCDLGSWASCSDVLTSETSHLFGPPNALLGVIFYIAVFAYPSVNFVPYREKLLLAVTSFSCALTIYLGSVLLKMGDFCILCVSTYVINWTLLIVVIREVRDAARQAKIAAKNNKKSS